MGLFSYLLQSMNMTQETESEGDSWRPRVNHAVTDNLTTNSSLFLPAVTHTATRNTVTTHTATRNTSAAQTATSNISTAETATSNIYTAETAANSDASTQGVLSAVPGQCKSAFASFFSLKAFFLIIWLLQLYSILLLY